MLKIVNKKYCMVTVLRFLKDVGINKDRFVLERILGKWPSHYEVTHGELVEVNRGPEYRDHRDGQISTDITETLNEGLHFYLILPSDCTVSFFTLGKNNLGRNKDMQRTIQEMKVIFWNVETAISIRQR